ncbi:MAG: hypothetical protein JWQ42_182 [Edaphobacter sp.]|nr:hypothetical protein [Edaphobacter sp.]
MSVIETKIRGDLGQLGQYRWRKPTQCLRQILVLVRRILIEKLPYKVEAQLIDLV